MKRSLSLILACLLAGFPLFSLGEAQTKPTENVSTLREQAAQGWQQSINVDSKTIQVDIDVEVPDVTSVPVLRIQLGAGGYTPNALPDELIVKTTDYLSPAIDPAPYIGAYGIYLNAPDGEYFVDKGGIQRRQPKAWNQANTLVHTWFRPWNTGKAYALDNAYTLGQAVADVQKRISSATQNKLSFSLNMVDTVGIYSVESWDGQSPDLDKLLTPEYYRLTFTQNLHGLPLLRAMDLEMMSAAAQDKHDDLNPVPPLSGLMATIANATSYSIGFKAVEETAVLHEDIPLCSLDTIKQQIINLVKSGKLRSVNSLRFGLVGYLDPNDMKSIVAVPSWVVMGNYYADPSQPDNYWNKFSPDGRAFIGGAGNYLRDIVINAQTGRVLVDMDDPKDQLMPEILSWE